MSNLLQKINIYCTAKRLRHWTRYKWNGEGIKYPGFTYYPRSPDFQDPPYEASKLFRVRRIKELKGVPYYEKEILKLLKLDGRINDIVIIKNIPEINARLWKVKHLIEIKPVTFPDGFPQNAEGTYLKENGQLVIRKELQPLKEKLLASEHFENNPVKMNGDTIRRYLRKRWLNGWW